MPMATLEHLCLCTGCLCQNPEKIMLVKEYDANNAHQGTKNP